MANIRKSFNFRSGLQVDNDNFVINSNGLVGIGTSLPSVYLLNVYGDTRITGLTTAKTIVLSDDLNVSGVTTVGFITASSLEVSGDANISGVLTASQLKVGSSEVVDNLIGYARTTFITDNGGVGLHTTSKIGINTITSPGASDPGLSVYGDVNVTGVITASSFSGSLTATDLTGTIDNARLPATISVTNVTATTFAGDLNGDATGLSGTPDITVNDVTCASVGSTGPITGTSIDVGSGIATAGTVDSTNISNSATVSSLDITASNSVGIGTDDTTYEAHIRRTGASDQSILKVTSDQKESIVAIGRSTSITDSNNENALLRFGNTNGAYQYSSYDTLDIINQGNGNINSYIDGTPPDNAFMWLRGTINPLMTLTRDGNLGIGITNPTHKLNVQGISTFTGNAYFNSNLTLDGNLILTSGSFTGDVTGDLTGNVTALSGTSSFNNLTGGAAIFTSLDITSGGDVTLDGDIGIGTTAPRSAVDFENAGVATKRFLLPPKVTTTERNNFALPLIEGSLIYNETEQRLELYNGTAWVGIATTT